MHKPEFIVVSAAIAACGFAALTLGCADRSSPAAVTSSDGPAVSATSGEAKTNADVQPVANAKAEPATARAQAARDITFDTVKLDMQKDDPFRRSLITPAIERLHGSKVRIRGYILPSFQQTGLTQFVLVRDNMQCCFGPGAALYDCIVVKMDEGKSTDFTTRPVAVEGVFSIEELRGPDDKCLAIYHLQGEKVQ